MKRLNKVLIICFLLLFTFQIGCEASSLAYTNTGTYVYQKLSTSSKRKWVKKNTKVYIIRSKNQFYQVYNARKTAKGYILKSCVSRKSSKSKQSSSWKDKVVKMEWSKGKKVLKRNGIATLYLVETSMNIQVKRLGGTQHMDLEPLESEDTEHLRRLSSGFSWQTHHVILKVNGKYIAASINTMPHGDSNIKNNNYNGHFCLHLVNSKTHETNKVNKEHQKTINKAYNWAH